MTPRQFKAVYDYFQHWNEISWYSYSRIMDEARHMPGVLNIGHRWTVRPRYHSLGDHPSFNLAYMYQGARIHTDFFILNSPIIDSELKETIETGILHGSEIISDLVGMGLSRRRMRAVSETRTVFAVECGDVMIGVDDISLVLSIGGHPEEYLYDGHGASWEDARMALAGGARQVLADFAGREEILGDRISIVLREAVIRWDS